MDWHFAHRFTWSVNLLGRCWFFFLRLNFCSQWFFKSLVKIMKTRHWIQDSWWKNSWYTCSEGNRSWGITTKFASVIKVSLRRNLQCHLRNYLSSPKLKSLIWGVYKTDFLITCNLYSLLGVKYVISKFTRSSRWKTYAIAPSEAWSTIDIASIVFSCWFIEAYIGCEIVHHPGGGQKFLKGLFFRTRLDVAIFFAQNPNFRGIYKDWQYHCAEEAFTLWWNVSSGCWLLTTVCWFHHYSCYWL